MHILLETQVSQDKFINRPHYRWWSRHFCDIMRSYDKLTRNCWIFLCLLLSLWTLIFEIYKMAGLGYLFHVLSGHMYFVVWSVSLYRCWNIISDKECLSLFVWTLVIEIQDGTLWRHYLVLSGHMLFFWGGGLTSQRLSLLEHYMRQGTYWLFL